MLPFKRQLFFTHFEIGIHFGETEKQMTIYCNNNRHQYVTSLAWRGVRETLLNIGWSFLVCMCLHMLSNGVYLKRLFGCMHILNVRVLTEVEFMLGLYKIRFIFPKFHFLFFSFFYGFDGLIKCNTSKILKINGIFKAQWNIYFFLKFSFIYFFYDQILSSIHFFFWFHFNGFINIIKSISKLNYLNIYLLLLFFFYKYCVVYLHFSGTHSFKDSVLKIIVFLVVVVLLLH